MARYIDTQYLFKCETCRYHRSGGCNTYCDHGEEYSPNLSKIPTADVAPKSEVEALQREIARLEKALRNSLPSYSQVISEEKAIELGKEYGRREVAREIFEEIEKVACVYKLDGDFYIDNGLYDELKKKYTEGEK